MKKQTKQKAKYHLMLGDQWISDYNNLAEVKLAKKRLMIHASPKNQHAIKSGNLWIIKGRRLRSKTQ